MRDEAFLHRDGFWEIKQRAQVWKNENRKETCYWKWEQILTNPRRNFSMQGPCKGYTGACQCSTLPTFHWQAVSGWPVLGNVAEVEYKCPRAVPGAIACLVNATILAINIFITLVCQHQYRLHNMSVFGENKNITKILASPDYEIYYNFCNQAFYILFASLEFLWSSNHKSNLHN